MSSGCITAKYMAIYIDWRHFDRNKGESQEMDLVEDEKMIEVFIIYELRSVIVNIFEWA